MSEAEEYGPGGMYADGPNTDIREYPDPEICGSCGSDNIAYVDDADGWTCFNCGATDADE